MNPDRMYLTSYYQLKPEDGVIEISVGRYIEIASKTHAHVVSHHAYTFTKEDKIIRPINPGQCDYLPIHSFSRISGESYLQFYHGSIYSETELNCSNVKEKVHGHNPVFSLSHDPSSVIKVMRDEGLSPTGSSIAYKFNEQGYQLNPVKVKMHYIGDRVVYSNAMTEEYIMQSTDLDEYEPLPNPILNPSFYNHKEEIIIPGYHKPETKSFTEVHRTLESFISKHEKGECVYVDGVGKDCTYEIRPSRLTVAINTGSNTVWLKIRSALLSPEAIKKIKSTNDKIAERMKSS